MSLDLSGDAAMAAAEGLVEDRVEGVDHLLLRRHVLFEVGE